MNKYILMTPGPVNVADNVREAVCKKDIGHREKDFSNLLNSIEQKLLTMFEIKAEENYRAVVISGSGTAANESMFSSVVGDQNILILSNGEFGGRIYEESKLHNKNTFLLEFPWGQPIDLDKVAAYLDQHKIDVIAVVHHETSSGILNPLDKIGALAKTHGARFIVDCVSSAGAEAIEPHRNNIAFFTSTSAKAIGSYPGLSFVVGKVSEFEKLESIPPKTAYLNLYKYYTFLKNRAQTPNTPAVPLFYALEQTLINILDDGIVERYADLKAKANTLRKGMRDLGLKFLVEEKEMCSILTAAYLPDDVNYERFSQKLRDKSIIIYPGKGCYEDKVFQISNIGDLSFDDIHYFLDALKEILADLKLG